MTDDALCLRDGDPHAAIRDAATLEEAVSYAGLELSRGRPDLLVYAFYSPAEGEQFRPLGKLFGEDAINHGELAGTLFRLGGKGTVFTEAVLRLGRPVWTSTIPRFGWHGLASSFRTHGVRSGGGFPVRIGDRMAAVLEVMSFERLQCDLASEALAGELADAIADRFRLHVLPSQRA
ncbi:MAG TPA: GAF domain-containing protein [Acidimicrobiales bacterium]|nr:GAF domain-containing protein [Acidimicrobiales bacterium]